MPKQKLRLVEYRPDDGSVTHPIDKQPNYKLRRIVGLGAGVLAFVGASIAFNELVDAWQGNIFNPKQTDITREQPDRAHDAYSVVPGDTLTDIVIKFHPEYAGSDKYAGDLLKDVDYLRQQLAANDQPLGTIRQDKQLIVDQLEKGETKNHPPVDRIPAHTP
jgi:hypothetical protein